MRLETINKNFQARLDAVLYEPELESVRFRRSTGPEKTENSLVELLKKYIHFAVSFCQKMFHEYCYQVYEILYC